MSVWLTSGFYFSFPEKGTCNAVGFGGIIQKTTRGAVVSFISFFRSLSVVIFLVFVLTPLIGNLAKLYDNFSKSRLFPTIVFAFLLVRLVQVMCYLIFRFKSVD